ncbi:hypothetical protein B0T20DRAFT_365234 [Sordaria brevicollis]|nr:hypothetical protein B0T20DRAFT_365234 [Sordaria brevicollis]
MHGGLQQPGSSAGPAIPRTNPNDQQKRRGKKAKRWTPQMDARLDLLKASNQTHENIARVLEAEFPSGEGLEPLNHNIVTKRLKELRETAGPANAIEICVNRWVPKALPVLKDEIARMIDSDGLGDLESLMAEAELELRGQSKKIFQNVLLRRKRAREAAAAAGPAASHAPARVTKPTGRNGGRPRGA